VNDRRDDPGGSPGCPTVIEFIGQRSGPRGTRRRRETRRLLEEAARAGSTAEHSALIDQVISLNLGVAREIARRYQRRGIPDEDLVQVANLALVKAAGGSTPGGAWTS
jgi:RNA polymerase sigma-B factor